MKRYPSARPCAVVLVLGLWAPTTFAAIVTDVAITGTFDVWQLTPPSNVLTNIGTPGTPPPLETYLTGTASDPLDNIELGNDRTYADWVANGRTTLTGDVVSGLSVALVTPTQADWTANGLELAYEYVDAALSSINKSRTDWIGPGTFDQAVAAFVFGDNQSASAAYSLSDPNVGYIDSLAGGGSSATISIGLQGNYDATAVLGDLLTFVGYDPANDPSPPQASEVLLLNVFDSAGTLLSSNFQYSFVATESGQLAEGCPQASTNPLVCSYTGNYAVGQSVNIPSGDVPNPVTSALLALGLIVLVRENRRARAKAVAIQ